MIGKIFALLLNSLFGETPSSCLDWKVSTVILMRPLRCSLAIILPLGLQVLCGQSLSWPLVIWALPWRRLNNGWLMHTWPFLWWNRCKLSLWFNRTRQRPQHSLRIQIVLLMRVCQPVSWLSVNDGVFCVKELLQFCLTAQWHDMLLFNRVRCQIRFASLNRAYVCD